MSVSMFNGNGRYDQRTKTVVWELVLNVESSSPRQEADGVVPNTEKTVSGTSDTESHSDLQPGMWSRNSNFRLQLQASKILAPAPERFGPLKTKNHCIICATRFPHKMRLWNWRPNFRLRLHHLKAFDSGHSKLLGLRLHSPACSWANRKTLLTYVNKSGNFQKAGYSPLLSATINRNTFLNQSGGLHRGPGPSLPEADRHWPVEKLPVVRELQVQVHHVISGASSGMDLETLRRKKNGSWTRNPCVSLTMSVIVAKLLLRASRANIDIFSTPADFRSCAVQATMTSGRWSPGKNKTRCFQRQILFSQSPDWKNVKNFPCLA